jgi:hypothetical protein
MQVAVVAVPGESLLAQLDLLEQADRAVAVTVKQMAAPLQLLEVQILVVVVVVLDIQRLTQVAQAVPVSSS